MRSNQFRLLKALASSGLVLCLAACASRPAPKPRPKADPEPTYRRVAIFIYEGAELLDFTGPAEVLSHVGMMKKVDGRPLLDVFTVAPEKGPVKTQNGMTILADYGLEDCPPPQIVVIPGGANDPLLKNDRIRAGLERITGQAEINFSVCTGAYVLARLGLLDGHRVTTHWGAIDGLRRRFPKVEVLEGRRFVDSGSIVTAAGVSAGIDGALHLVERLVGRGMADHVADYMEYDRRDRLPRP